MEVGLHLNTFQEGGKPCHTATLPTQRKEPVAGVGGQGGMQEEGLIFFFLKLGDEILRPSGSIPGRLQAFSYSSASAAIRAVMDHSPWDGDTAACPAGGLGPRQQAPPPLLAPSATPGMWSEGMKESVNKRMRAASCETNAEEESVQVNGY